MLYSYNAIVTRVVDGDTFVCDVDLGFKLWTKDVRVRLLNYNAPESKGTEKAFGAIAKKVTIELLTNKSIVLRTIKLDDFGRYLGEVWINGDVNLVDKLVAEGYGVNWDGKGTRPVFDVTKPYPLIR